MSKKKKKGRKLPKWEELAMDYDKSEDIPPLVKTGTSHVKRIPNVGVAYLKADGTRVELGVYGWDTAWERLLLDPTQYTLLEKTDGVTWLIMPQEKAQYYTARWYEPKPVKPRPLMCVFDATKKYCQQMFGVTLDKYDEDFFINHPLVDKDGVPMAHTMQVVQELVTPYGLRVSRVRVAAGQSLLGENFDIWLKALGVNPLGGMDRRTTNREWLEHSPKDATDYRFEYSDQPLRPSVSCGVLSGATSGVSTGWTMGHAAYIAPRDEIHGASLSLQLARAEYVPWRCDIPQGPLFVEELEKAEAPPKSFTGFDLGEWAKDNPVKYKPYTPSEPISAPKSSSTPVISPSGRVCGSCGKLISYLYNGPPNTCRDCWELALDELSCTGDFCTQNAATSHNMPAFFYVRWDAPEKRLVIKCRNCMKEFGIVETTGTEMSYCHTVWEGTKNYYDQRDALAS